MGHLGNQPTDPGLNPSLYKVFEKYGLGQSGNIMSVTIYE